jgi:hypothetical protein
MASSPPTCRATPAGRRVPAVWIRPQEKKQTIDRKGTSPDPDLQCHRMCYDRDQEQTRAPWTLRNHVKPQAGQRHRTAGAERKPLPSPDSRQPAGEQWRNQATTAAEEFGKVGPNKRTQVHPKIVPFAAKCRTVPQEDSRSHWPAACKLRLGDDEVRRLWRRFGMIESFLGHLLRSFHWASFCLLCHSAGSGLAGRTGWLMIRRANELGPGRGG